MEGIEEYNGVLEVSIGYTSAMGTMLAEEVAFTNDIVGALSQQVVVLIDDHDTGCLENDHLIRRLKASHHALEVHLESFMVETATKFVRRNLTISVLRARLNNLAPMVVDLTGEEEEEEEEVQVRVESPQISLEWGNNNVLVVSGMWDFWASNF
ncbi:hypothetical protein BDM02DRAFT_3192343 [Thelephora ganbajun]|uniref:Uncharacterized protein n=1 Tax=Thelephora ganbajun TaxID=370292 RepID=A0ACB6Z006_THEGA|nr:hypothetical protein BDM02DRAFT_3192343 [Thelephora ganbajun]